MSEAPAVIVKDGGIEGLNVFGAVDINKHGRVGSHMPSFYYKTHREELSNNIESTEKALERGEIMPDNKPQVLADLRKMKEKRDAVDNSDPKLTGQQETETSRLRKDLGTKITEAMFTRSDMQKGLADAHEEARRMAQPCIKLSEKEALIANKCGCRISNNGMISRTDAERVWKICSRMIGENSNTEALRR